ncbi:hypothetical protein [Streptomyces sp.]|uniref:hypothetical protein n=1 Tax=Streptomyces sp. TaxID=1931 RepID=UPI002F933806
MSAHDPIIVPRFDVAVEPAPEEEPVLIVGAVADDGQPVALLLDRETRAKVGGWLLPESEMTSRELAAARTELVELRTRMAELEAETYVAPSPSCTRCYGADAARFVAKGGATSPCRVCGPSEVDLLRARVAELEAGRVKVLREAADAIVADNDRKLWASKPGKHWAADLLRRMANEDPHDSDLHRDYVTPHDLPPALDTPGSLR